MTDVTAIPGAEALVGKGVYRRMPACIPKPVGNRHAVVAGAPAACIAGARQLGEAGWTVTIVTREQCVGCGVSRHCRRKACRDVACATGVEYLEALVLRRIDDGRIEALNAAALFVL